MITHLRGENGKSLTENEDMIKLAEHYYTTLYTPSKTDLRRQQRVLRNMISAEDRNLDVSHSLKELTKAVFQQKDHKSPGPDGITVEFYKAFWQLIQFKYLEYINTSKHSLRTMN